MVTVKEKDAGLHKHVSCIAEANMSHREDHLGEQGVTESWEQLPQAKN